jgi:hypothetical protein
VTVATSQFQSSLVGQRHFGAKNTATWFGPKGCDELPTMRFSIFTIRRNVRAANRLHWHWHAEVALPN